MVNDGFPIRPFYSSLPPPEDTEDKSTSSEKEKRLSRKRKRYGDRPSIYKLAAPPTGITYFLGPDEEPPADIQNPNTDPLEAANRTEDPSDSEDDRTKKERDVPATANRTSVANKPAWSLISNPHDDLDKRYERLKTVDPVSSLLRLPPGEINPSPIQDLVGRGMTSDRTELRWTSPNIKDESKKPTKYLVQCRTDGPGILGVVYDACPIKSLQLPPPGPPGTFDYAKITFIPTFYTAACKCSVQTVDKSGCVSLPSNEIHVQNAGDQNEGAALAMIVLGCIFGLSSIVAMSYLLWNNRHRRRRLPFRQGRSGPNDMSRTRVAGRQQGSILVSPTGATRRDSSNDAQCIHNECLPADGLNGVICVHPLPSSGENQRNITPEGSISASLNSTKACAAPYSVDIENECCHQHAHSALTIDDVLAFSAGSCHSTSITKATAALKHQNPSGDKCNPAGKDTLLSGRSEVASSESVLAPSVIVDQSSVVALPIDTLVGPLVQENARLDPPDKSVV